ncbi:hypothetical protein EVAR_3668_1 [Eumeta japonica]|uniref:Uncharacterized protein n=1 Tax=Eumeta variegata TaxID=151549 RepID=A0A4C1SUI7_EUMVA|nr:hypothetical protein EVAR_3668_1 [Eumeta japonica]
MSMVTSALPASWEGIVCLMEGNGLMKGIEGEWTTGTFTHWTKPNSESYNFTSVFSSDGYGDFVLYCVVMISDHTAPRSPLSASNADLSPMGFRQFSSCPPSFTQLL